MYKEKLKNRAENSALNVKIARLSSLRIVLHYKK